MRCIFNPNRVLRANLILAGHKPRNMLLRTGNRLRQLPVRTETINSVDDGRTVSHGRLHSITRISVNTHKCWRVSRVAG